MNQRVDKTSTPNMEQKKQRRELSEETRMEIIDKHSKGKGYKSISKQLDVPVTTVANIIQKFKIYGTVENLPGRGRKRKIDDKLKKRIIEMVMEKPRTTSKEIQNELQGQGTSLSDHTIRRCLRQSGLKGRRPRRTPLVKAKHKKPKPGVFKRDYKETTKLLGECSLEQQEKK